ncbi:MAG: hypothetical protein Q3988_02225 [Gemella sp.]|nr:hypothetical protein [Gemella sp.]
MFIYWLIIVVIIVKIAEFMEKIKDKKFIGVNINKIKRKSIPSKIKYL